LEKLDLNALDLDTPIGVFLTPKGTEYALKSPNQDQKHRRNVLEALLTKLETEMEDRFKLDEEDSEGSAESSDLRHSLDYGNNESLEHIVMLNTAVSSILKNAKSHPNLPNLKDNTLKSKVKSPEEAFELLKEGNKRFLSNQLENQKDINLMRKALLHGGQKPHSIIVTCSDSRVPPEMIFDQGLGDLFVIRLAGNVIDTYAKASILYAVNHLNAPLVLVMGHEKCGAVGAALASDDALINEPDEIKAMVSKIRNGFKLDIEYENQDARQVCACVQNVDHQCATLLNHSCLQDKIANKDLMIKGGYYDFTGAVTFF